MVDEDIYVSGAEGSDPPDPDWRCLGDGLMPFDSGGYL